MVIPLSGCCWLAMSFKLSVVISVLLSLFSFDEFSTKKFKFPYLSGLIQDKANEVSFTPSKIFVCYECIVMERKLWKY